MKETWISISRKILSRPKWIAAGTVAVLVLVIMVQNMEPVTLDFLFWNTGPFAKLWLMVACMLVGVVLAEIVRYLRRR